MRRLPRAGRPLATPAGVKLGTLCLIDQEPRTLSDPDRLTLEDLAGWAEREINLSIELARMHARLVSVLDNIVEGALLFSTDGRIQWANGRASQLLGIAAPDLAGRSLESIFVRESLDRVSKAIDALLGASECSTGRMEVQMRHSNGRSLPVKSVLVVAIVGGERFITALIDPV